MFDNVAKAGKQARKGKMGNKMSMLKDTIGRVKKQGSIKDRGPLQGTSSEAGPVKPALPSNASNKARKNIMKGLVNRK